MIIGLSGKAQSGKNTVCDMIIYTIYYHRYYNVKKQKGYIEYNQEFSTEHMQKVEQHFMKIMSDYNIFIHSFAYKLKLVLTAFCNHTVDEFENVDFKNSEVDWLTIEDKHPTYRELLQKFGTAIRNGVCSDFWVQVALNDPVINDRSCINIFTDVRFFTEVEGLKQKGAKIIRINRDGAGAGNHVSEIELDNYEFDVVINNNGSKQELLEQVRVLCENLNLI